MEEAIKVVTSERVFFIVLNMTLKLFEYAVMQALKRILSTGWHRIKQQTRKGKRIWIF